MPGGVQNKKPNEERKYMTENQRRKHVTDTLHNLHQRLAALEARPSGSDELEQRLLALEAATLAPEPELEPELEPEPENIRAEEDALMSIDFDKVTDAVDAALSNAIGKVENGLLNDALACVRYVRKIAVQRARIEPLPEEPTRRLGPSVPPPSRGSATLREKVEEANARDDDGNDKLKLLADINAAIDAEMTNVQILERAQRALLSKSSS